MVLVEVVVLVKVIGLVLQGGGRGGVGGCRGGGGGGSGGDGRVWLVKQH